VSTVLLLAGLLLPAAAAWALLRRLDPGAGDLPGQALRAGLALVVGPAALTVLAYGWLVAGLALGPAYAAVEAVLCVAVVAWAVRGWRPPEGAPTRPDAIGSIALAVAAAAILLSVVVFVRGAVASPHGDWDAWAIWNHRARFLFRGGGTGWRAAFDPALAWSNTGYPLLVPTAIARLWAWAGDGSAAPRLVAGLFALAPLLVVLGAVARAAGLVPAAAAVALVAANVGWFVWAFAQGADVPAGALLCAGVAALVEADRAEGPRRRGLEALAGLALGLSAWTKDEGLMFVAVFVPFALLRAASTGARARAGALALGLALPLAARAHFQLAVAPALAAALSAGQTVGGVLSRVVDGARWSQIISATPRHLPGVGQGLPLLPFVVALLAAARRRALLASYAVPAVAAYGVFLLVYAATPLPLAYHITTSAPRIFQQPWPALLLGLLAAAGRASSASAGAGEPTSVAGGGRRRERREGRRAGAAR
jgi:hypothetical protein